MYENFISWNNPAVSLKSFSKARTAATKREGFLHNARWLNYCHWVTAALPPSCTLLSLRTCALSTCVESTRMHSCINFQAKLALSSQFTHSLSTTIRHWLKINTSSIQHLRHWLHRELDKQMKGPYRCNPFDGQQGAPYLSNMAQSCNGTCDLPPAGVRTRAAVYIHPDAGHT